MAKRLTDTNKYKKPFIRGLQGPYKLLWDYLYHDCDHAGIWQVDFQIAQIYIGEDMPVNEKDALKYFNEGEERVVVLNGGSKWLIRTFIEFQYGDLNPDNRVHQSVLRELRKYKIKPLASPLQGCKEKDKDKDKEKDKEKNKIATKIPDDLKESEKEILDWIEYKKQRGEGYRSSLGLTRLWNAFRSIPAEKRRESVDNCMANNWAGLFELKKTNGLSAAPLSPPKLNDLALKKMAEMKAGK